MNYKLLTGILLLAAVSCKQAEDTPKSVPSSRTTHNVEVQKAMPYSGLNTFQYSGLVEAKQSTPLSFKTPGTVTAINIEEGQYVKAGQLLAKLDATNAQSAYDLSFLQQQQAQDAYDRMKPMHENGTLPEIRWVELETRLSQATTATEMARHRIEDTNLYAPKSGIIGSKNIQVGMNVLPSVSAFDLLNINTIYVNVPVPESEVGQLRKGQVARVEIGAIGETRTGKIEEIGVIANPITHAYPVKIALDNEGWDIKPGMVCHVQIGSTQEVAGIAISNKALQRNAAGAQFVYVLQDSTVTTKYVQTLDLTDSQVLVSGLSENDLIIISGQYKLTDGSKVNIVNTVN